MTGISLGLAESLFQPLLADNPFVASRTAIATTGGSLGTIPETAVYVGFTGIQGGSAALPSSPVTGQILFLKDEGGNASVNPIVLSAGGADIDAATSYSIATNYGSLTLLWNGTFWSIIGHTNNMSLTINPYSLALFDVSGTGPTINVSAHNGQGQPVLFTDTNNVSYASVAVVLPPGTAAGLSYLITQTKPDATHPLNLPVGVVGFDWAVAGTASGPQVSFNFGGTTDGSAGSGTTGFATGHAPTASTPDVAYATEVRTVGV